MVTLGILCITYSVIDTAYGWSLHRNYAPIDHPVEWQRIPFYKKTDSFFTVLLKGMLGAPLAAAVGALVWWCGKLMGGDGWSFAFCFLVAINIAHARKYGETIANALIWWWGLLSMDQRRRRRQRERAEGRFGA